MAQGRKRLAATTIALLACMTGVAEAQVPIEPLGSQLRLTNQGVDGTQDVDAREVDIAYNSVRNEYLVVWENTTSLPAFDREIFARRLTANGTPIGAAFQVSGLAGSDLTADASDPAVAYNPERDHYGVAFIRVNGVQGVEVNVQTVSGAGQIIEFDGDPGPQPALGSLIGAGSAREADIVYRADSNGDAAPGDRWIVAYAGDETVASEFEVFAGAIVPTSGGGVVDVAVSSMAGATADALDPSITVVPGSDDVAVAFEGSFNGSEFEIFAKRMPGNLPPGMAGQTPITNTLGATGSAFDAAITADPHASELLVAFQADKVADQDFEIGVQRLDLGLGPRGADDQVVSSAGPAGSGTSFGVSSPASAYNAATRRYVVSWIGNDTGRPGLSNDEREVQATTLNAAGVEGAPQDFVISRMGADNDEDASPVNTALAVNGASKRWLSVWSSDDARPPLADNEIELWGRHVGENFDRDGDGSLFPADCNDVNAAVRPGAPDVFDNGVDEDCVGGDAQNPDRDGDGSPRPQDCNDANAAIRPGIRDIPNNEIDEDCAGGPRRTRVDVDIERTFAVFRGFTKVTRLRIKKLKTGMRVQLRCKGKGCPKALRKNKVKRTTMKKSGTKDFTKLFKKARLKPKAVLDVRVLQTGAIGRVDRFVIRNAKLPKRQQRCLPPGVKKPQRC